ncbi:hypothetical protein I3842_09G135900 [Carya illinoinensis]|uniref:Uncharacterized protein n=1 Tax=Carya illinoinensis TaxID=32201 RepID=A0A922E3S1_CARIL|nr:hypothetical protein I3842_09G135900 [Carya illinoinensis]
MVCSSAMANNCSSGSGSGSSARLRVLLLFIFFLLHTLHGSSAPLLHGHSGSPTRSLLGTARSQIPDCTQLVSDSLCSQNPKCRWCRSESIDDTCFTRLEALRLPRQISSLSSDGTGSDKEGSFSNLKCMEQEASE